MHTHDIIPLGKSKKKDKNKTKKKSSCHKSKANIQSPTHHKQCLQKRTKPQSILMVPKWIGQWMMGYIHDFQDWKLECELILDGEIHRNWRPQKVNTLI